MNFEVNACVLQRALKVFDGYLKDLKVSKSASRHNVYFSADKAGNVSLKLQIILLDYRNSFIIECPVYSVCVDMRGFEIQLGESYNKICERLRSLFSEESNSFMQSLNIRYDFDIDMLILNSKSFSMTVQRCSCYEVFDTAEVSADKRLMSELFSQSFGAYTGRDSDGVISVYFSSEPKLSRYYMRTSVSIIRRNLVPVQMSNCTVGTEEVLTLPLRVFNCIMQRKPYAYSCINLDSSDVMFVFYLSECTVKVLNDTGLEVIDEEKYRAMLPLIPCIAEDRVSVMSTAVNSTFNFKFEVDNLHTISSVDFFSYYKSPLLNTSGVVLKELEFKSLDMSYVVSVESVVSRSVDFRIDSNNTVIPARSVLSDNAVDFRVDFDIFLNVLKQIPGREVYVMTTGNYVYLFDDFAVGVLMKLV